MLYFLNIQTFKMFENFNYSKNFINSNFIFSQTPSWR